MLQKTRRSRGIIANEVYVIQCIYKKTKIDCYWYPLVLVFVVVTVLALWQTSLALLCSVGFVNFEGLQRRHPRAQDQGIQSINFRGKKSCSILDLLHVLNFTN